MQALVAPKTCFLPAKCTTYTFKRRRSWNIIGQKLPCIYSLIMSFADIYDTDRELKLKYYSCRYYLFLSGEGKSGTVRVFKAGSWPGPSFNFSKKNTKQRFLKLIEFGAMTVEIRHRQSSQLSLSPSSQILF